VVVSVGASAAVFGLCGLLLASSVWGLLHRSSVTMPLMEAKRLALPLGIFFLYNLVTDNMPGVAEFTGFAVGAVCGGVLTRHVNERVPEPRLVGAALAATVVMAAVIAFPFRNIVDVKPEIASVVALEDKTSGAYKGAFERFRSGRMTADALARVIDDTIMPQLQAADAHLKSLGHVPQEHQQVVADAEEYLRLRSESWRLRAEGLRKNSAALRDPVPTSFEAGRLRAEAQHRANMTVMGKAEGAERASLEALQKVRTADLK
jgi:hypothetical protein